jgi:hypothetical protein
MQTTNKNNGAEVFNQHALILGVAFKGKTMATNVVDYWILALQWWDWYEAKSS